MTEKHAIVGGSDFVGKLRGSDEDDEEDESDE